MSDTTSIHSRMITSAYDGYNVFSPQFRKLHQTYKGDIDEAKKKELATRGKSSIGIRVVKGLVHRLVSGFANAYFSNESFANISPIDAKDEANARKKQKAFDFYWTKTGMKPYNSLSKNFLDVSVYGTTVAKCYWANNRPTIEHINIHNVYFDPSATSRDDIRYLVHKIYLTKDDIRRFKKDGIYNTRFKMDEIVAGGYNDNAQLDAISNVTEMTRVELHDVYVKKDGKWTVSTMYKETTYLRKEVVLNDGLPFFIGNCMPRTIDPNDTEVRIYADSPIAGVVELQDEVNIRTNQEIDAISELLNPSYFSEAGSGLQESKLKRGAGKVVQINDMTKIKEVTQNPVGVLQANQDRLQQHIKAISGIDVLFTGDNSAMINRQTADGMNIISSEQNVRMDSYIRCFNETFIEPLATHIMTLIWKYNTYKHLFNGVDRTQDTMTNVSVNAGLGATSTQIKLQGLDNAFQKFMAIQDADKAIRTIKDSLPLLGIKNTTDYFPDDDDEEAKAQKEQQAKEMMAKQQEQEQLQMQMQMAELEKIKAETQKAIQELQLKAQASQIEAEKIQLEHQSNMGKIDNKNRELDIKEIELEYTMKQGINNAE